MEAVPSATPVPTGAGLTTSVLRAPICGRCGANRVEKKRNGSWFPTCYTCG